MPTPARRATSETGFTASRRALVAFLALALSGAATTFAPAADASDTNTRWETFSESPGCGASYTRTPFASRTGSLGTGEVILGPYGTYFGRSLAEVRSKLVFWTVPGSGGRRIQVHEAMLSDLQRVTANLGANASQGRVYPVTEVSGFVSRTIGGSHQISRHALGLAVDINPAQNPHHADGELITNMPAWFVDAWTSEGFCWGGSWRGERTRCISAGWARGRHLRRMIPSTPEHLRPPHEPLPSPVRTRRRSHL